MKDLHEWTQARSAGKRDTHASTGSDLLPGKLPAWNRMMLYFGPACSCDTAFAVSKTPLFFFRQASKISLYTAAVYLANCSLIFYYFTSPCFRWRCQDTGRWGDVESFQGFLPKLQIGEQFQDRPDFYFIFFFPSVLLKAQKLFWAPALSGERASLLAHTSKNAVAGHLFPKVASPLFV